MIPQKIAFKKIICMFAFQNNYSYSNFLIFNFVTKATGVKSFTFYIILYYFEIAKICYFSCLFTVLCQRWPFSKKKVQFLLISALKKVV